jgi:hypothetical protein
VLLGELVVSRAPPSDDRPGLGRAQTLRAVAGCAAIAAAVVWINRDNVAQHGVLVGRYQPLAAWFDGGPPPTTWTCPPWGYPWLLHLFSLPQTLVLQWAVAVAAMAAVWTTFAQTTRARGLLALLCVAAIPWWVLASLKIADFWSAAFGVLGVVALVRCLATGAARWAIAAGAGFGLSLAFRSEFLLILAAIPLVLAVVARDLVRTRWASLLGALAVTLALALPWGVFRVAHGAPFGIMSSSGGLALYNSLGFNGNAWGLVAGDQLREREVAAALGPGVTINSYEGDRWLMARALDHIRERPGEYARKVVHTFRASVLYGFHGISVEPLLGEADAQQYEVLKEQLKLRAGTRMNPLDVEEFRRQGRWQESFELRSVPLRLWAIAALPLANMALSMAFLLGVIAASAWLVGFDRARLARPAVAVPFAALWAMWALLCLTQWEPRQANVLYPLGIPIWIAGADGVRAALARRRARRA